MVVTHCYSLKNVVRPKEGKHSCCKALGRMDFWNVTVTKWLQIPD